MDRFKVSQDNYNILNNVVNKRIIYNDKIWVLHTLVFESTFKEKYNFWSWNGGYRTIETIYLKSFKITEYDFVESELTNYIGSLGWLKLLMSIHNLVDLRGKYVDLEKQINAFNHVNQ